MGAGSSSTRLIVVRGNSGAGKSSVAAEVRARYGRGIALVGQDNLRRIVLRERDGPGGANIGLIGAVARYALDNGFHVIIDGILRADAYGAMLGGLHRDHQGLSRFYYLDVPFGETMRRHATRPQAAEFGRAEMSCWYRGRDLLPGGIEQVIPAANSLEDTVRQVMHEAGLTGQPRDMAVSRGRDVLALRVVEDALVAPSRPRPGLLDAADGHGRVGDDGTVEAEHGEGGQVELGLKGGSGSDLFLSS